MWDLREGVEESAASERAVTCRKARRASGSMRHESQRGETEKERRKKGAKASQNNTPYIFFIGSSVVMVVPTLGKLHYYEIN